MNLQFLKHLIMSSIGRKIIMAVTGLMLIGFIFFHLGINLLLFKGSGIYNGAVNIITTPITPILEIGLAVLFLIHIIIGTWVRIEDWFNRPKGYYERRWQGGRTIGSATMLYTAIILLAFLVYHIITFRFGDHSAGMYQMVASTFKNPLCVVLYLIGASAIVLHMSHGVQSAFQTLGLNHPVYMPIIKMAGWAVAVIMVCFALIPIYFFSGFDITDTVKDLYQTACLFVSKWIF